MRAVHFAHQRGILHRDLKPGNILLDADDQPHVTDFGLAKNLSEATTNTRSGAIVGTPSYMAPEQAAARKDLSVAVDVYSLGAIFFELLTGSPPFRASSAMETILQVLEKDPPRPRLLNSRIDSDLETITLKCLEKNPQHRYASALLLAEDLERSLAGEPIRARPASMKERAFKWMRRRPAMAALVGVIALSVLCLLALGIGYHLRLQAAYHEAEERHKETEEQRKLADTHRAEVERQRKRLEMMIDFLRGRDVQFEKQGRPPMCVGSFYTTSFNSLRAYSRRS